MCRIDEQPDSVKPQIAYVLTVALLLFTTAIDALADQYSCSISPKGYGPNVRGVEATSKAEAEYKTREQNPSYDYRTYNVFCINRSAENRIENSSDIFVRDSRFRNQRQLQPYLPADLKNTGKPPFKCDSTGGFLPDGSKDHGKCHELRSTSTKATYKVRFSSGGISGLTSQVWTRDGGNWKLWVEFHNTDLRSASADAQKYAVAHGTTDPQQGGTNPMDNSAPPSPDASSVESAVKKSIGDLLKGFGR